MNRDEIDFPILTSRRYPQILTAAITILSVKAPAGLSMIWATGKSSGCQKHERSRAKHRRIQDCTQ